MCKKTKALRISYLITTELKLASVAIALASVLLGSGTVRNELGHALVFDEPKIIESMSLCRPAQNSAVGVAFVGTL